jgi:hypothetical protein
VGLRSVRYDVKNYAENGHKKARKTTKNGCKSQQTNLHSSL